MHGGIQTELRPEDSHEDSLRGEALRVSHVQGQLQRPETYMKLRTDIENNFLDTQSYQAYIQRDNGYTCSLLGNFHIVS